MLRQLDLPKTLMPKLVDPGTVLGCLNDDVRHAAGLHHGALIAPCTHDTSSAVAAMPGLGDDWAFISCGTWSVVGAITPEIMTGPKIFRAGLSNGLAFRQTYLYQNIIGLWLLQQAQTEWTNDGNAYSHADLIRAAGEAPANGPLIDVNDPRFVAPSHMVGAIRDYCRDTSQASPATPAEVARCILESLALGYRRVIEQLAQVLGRSFNAIHVVGGGSQNGLLCQFTAEATGLPVLAGPTEATAMGNLLVQACARGPLTGADDVRNVVRRSCTPATYKPAHPATWDRRYESYSRLLKSSTNEECCVTTERK